jgi:hypothetical protein
MKPPPTQQLYKLDKPYEKPHGHSAFSLHPNNPDLTQFCARFMAHGQKKSRDVTCGDRLQAS